MEVSPNVDEMLLEAMSGQKLEPLPEKPQEVSRETNSHDAAQLEKDIGANSPQLEAVSPNKETAKTEKPKAETNEYGDKAESVGKADKVESSENEYGLETQPEKLYTKAELDEHTNRVMRERVARFERNQQQQQPTQQQQQTAAQQGFQYDENSNQDWQQQLEQFVLQVADKREQTQAARLQQAVEQESMQKFESKFKQGMSKFNDYHEVLGGKSVTDAMLMAASEVNDPAALFYAAAKRMPDELAKIAEIKSPLAQAAAIGRLDEKLRKQSVQTSKAPKPISPTKTDTTTVFQPKETSGNELDDLLVQDKNSRLAQLNARRR
jgi:hypothetical protein